LRLRAFFASKKVDGAIFSVYYGNTSKKAYEQKGMHGFKRGYGCGFAKSGIAVCVF